MKKPTLPKLSRPSRPAGGKTAVPPALADLMRDMRDRRLIVPAIALVVMILAVPVLLSADAEPPPAAAPLALPEGAEQVLPAVLAEQQVGVRDYRERLDALKSKDPFKQRFKMSQEAIDEVSELTEIPAPPSGGASAGGSGGSNPAPTASPPSGGGGGGSVPSGGGAPKPAPPAASPEPEPMPVVSSAELRFGKKGEMRRRSVEPGEMLPGHKRPVLLFAGATPDLKRAIFFVSSGVVATSGDGQCTPSPKVCQYLTLRPGQSRRFVYGGGGAVYHAKLLGLDWVELKGAKLSD